MAPLHVANAALEDTTDPQWRAYFTLCVNCYADLFGAFRVAEGIVRSLLSIALRKGAMSGAEAQGFMQRVYAKGLSHEMVGKANTATFVVDLKLAMTDRPAAKLEILAELFDNLSLFDEFIDANPPEIGTGVSMPVDSV